jgi:outer membrane protein assembly factor BamB
MTPPDVPVDGQGKGRAMWGADALKRDRTGTGMGRWGLVALASVVLLAGCDREIRLEGERFGTRVPLVASLTGNAAAETGPGADVARAISLPAANTYSTWAQRGYDAQNRTPHATLSANLTQVWSTNIGPGNARRSRLTADPVAANGVVFTLDAHGGRARPFGVQWRPHLVGGPDRRVRPRRQRLGRRPRAERGYAFRHDRLWRTCGDGPLQRRGALAAASRRRDRISDRVGQHRLRCQPRQPGLGDLDRCGSHPLGAALGPAQALLEGGAAPAVSGGTVVFPFGTGELVAANTETGVRTWATAVAGGRLGVAYSNINDITGDPVIAGGTLYAGNQSGRVVALSAASGERLWTATEGSYSPVLVAGDSLFFVSDRNELIRIDASTGERIWGTELPLYVRDRERRRRAVFTHYGPILAGGRLVVASGDRQIRMFDPVSGALVQSAGLRGGAASHPIVVNNTLMVVTGDGRLVAYR